MAGADDKGSPVDLDGMTSTTPGSWTKEAPANKMRFAQPARMRSSQSDIATRVLPVPVACTRSARRNFFSKRSLTRFTASSGRVMSAGTPFRTSQKLKL